MIEASGENAFSDFFTKSVPHFFTKTVPHYFKSCIAGAGQGATVAAFTGEGALAAAGLGCAEGVSAQVLSERVSDQLGAAAEKVGTIHDISKAAKAFSER